MTLLSSKGFRVFFEVSVFGSRLGESVKGYTEVFMCLYTGQVQFMFHHLELSYMASLDTKEDWESRKFSSMSQGRENEFWRRPSHLGQSNSVQLMFPS